MKRTKLILIQDFIANGLSFKAAGIWYPNENVAPSCWQENAENPIGRPDAARRAEAGAQTSGPTRDAEN